MQGKPRDIGICLKSSWLPSNEDAFMSGYRCLVLKRHVAKAVTGAVKMNYKIHGNSRFFFYQ